MNLPASDCQFGGAFGSSARLFHIGDAEGCTESGGESSICAQVPGPCPCWKPGKRGPRSFRGAALCLRLCSEHSQARELAWGHLEDLRGPEAQGLRCRGASHCLAAVPSCRLLQPCTAFLRLFPLNARPAGMGGCFVLKLHVHQGPMTVSVDFGHSEENVKCVDPDEAAAYEPS